MEWLKKNWYLMLPIIAVLSVASMVILVETSKNDFERVQACIAVHFNQSKYDTRLVKHCEKIYQDWKQEDEREQKEMERRNIEEMMEELR